MAGGIVGDGNAPRMLRGNDGVVLKGLGIGIGIRGGSQAR